MTKVLKDKLSLSLISGILLSLGWLQLGLGWIILFAFVPILFVLDKQLLVRKISNAAEFSLYCLISFVIWNTISTYWIYKATIPGAIAVILISSFLMSGLMFISFRTFELLGIRIGLVVFVTNWVAYEYLFMNSQISWPWLVLGNAFADNVSLIQWYEFTGHLGGSVWILIVNVLIYKLLKLILEKKEKRAICKLVGILSIFLLVPFGYSLFRYHTYTEVDKPVAVVVIQPNIDPYNEKFSIPVQAQLEIILRIAEQYNDSEVEYFIAPETAITYGVWENDISTNHYIMFIRDFLKGNPMAKFIIGANTLKKYPGGKDKTETAVESGNSGNYFDIFNTSLQIDSSKNVDIYHKSKLVPGIEMLPYPNLFWFLKDLMLDLGGMTGSHGTQKEREVFKNEILDINVGVPVCYESVYGQFISEFVLKGAELLFIITNDGWWGNTPGYKQHLNFSRLRAVETRRSIARSANTGISCIINQRGDIVISSEWWQAGAIRGNVNANNKMTFYVKNGDYLARMTVVISALILIILIGSYINEKIKNN
ncbi:MAG: apolipoprotein N-acyltransferase [Bacteroidales bacterium]|nr:apolipoprotein N-acyltransferase [Bacteroidales bacterium]